MAHHREHSSNGEGDEPPRHHKKQKLREDLRAMQDQIRALTENLQVVQQENEMLAQQLEDLAAGADHANHNADQDDPPHAALSKSDVKFWKKAATVAGRRVAALHAPFLDFEPLAGHQVQAHMDEILDDVSRAKEDDEELDDDDNPALYWDSPRFEIPDVIDLVREVVFNLPRPPSGPLWCDVFFNDAMNLGARKQRGDIVHAVAKHHEKVFGIMDERFMDRKQRPEIPEVQDLACTFMHTAEGDPLGDFFKDECIVRVLRLLLNGHGAILTGRRSPKSRKPHVDMWHIKVITPSLLAFAATVIKYVLSGEPSFEEASGPTNYTTWYLSRLGLLEGVFADEPDTYNSLINYYNRKVLPDRYREVAYEPPVEDAGAHNHQAGLSGEERAFLARIRGEA